jgi:hypothetical protein
MTGVAARSKRPSELCSYLLSRAVASENSDKI